jgi:osmotically-inducible protein OsmY
VNQEKTMLKTDMQLKSEIEDELRWDPKVNAAQIGVSVDTGVVSLLGTVDTFAEKLAAQDAVKRVSGVRTIAQDLKVKILTEHVRTDSDIAAAVQSALEWDVFVPTDITAKIRAGEVTLNGQATWNYERDSAERAVRSLTGVVAVHNLVTLKSHISATQVKEQVEAALRRQATESAQSIHVETSGGQVTLTGHASSWRAIEDAATAAWAAPGVTQVIDRVKLSMTHRTP